MEAEGQLQGHTLKRVGIYVSLQFQQMTKTGFLDADILSSMLFTKHGCALCKMQAGKTSTYLHGQSLDITLPSFLNYKYPCLDNCTIENIPFRNITH
jgi:hypothetical protein